MSSTKRALLIASPFQGLRGPMDDVKIMASVLTSSFTGTLDVELTYLLGAITDRGRKVTAIFDCCHSGRMARDPSDDESMPRNLPKVQYANV
ncbi:uncharacterized protein CTRU02_213186 [Colletotrichum truncatum]|uniref:Uncharacterized protein n=1 Tax=Colletotrichum truncatum TaxID=5467 RepID=A0ACC3YK45_COLTU